MPLWLVNEKDRPRVHPIFMICVVFTCLMVMDRDSKAEYKELTRRFLRVLLIVKTLVVGLITDNFEVTSLILMWSETPKCLLTACSGFWFACGVTERLVARTIYWIVRWLKKKQFKEINGENVTSACIHTHGRIYSSNVTKQTRSGVRVADIWLQFLQHNVDIYPRYGQTFRKSLAKLICWVLVRIMYLHVTETKISFICRDLLVNADWGSNGRWKEAQTESQVHCQLIAGYMCRHLWKAIIRQLKIRKVS